LLCVIWGTTWSVIQIGLEGIPPFSGAAIRFAVAGLVLLLLARGRGVQLGRTPRERWIWLVNGALSFAGSYGVVYWAEQWVPSGLTAVLFAIYPLTVAIMAHFLLPDEPLRARELAGVLVAFAGVGVIFSEDFSLLGGPQVALAALVMLCSPIAAAGGSVAVKRWGSGIHPLSVSAVPMLVGAGLLAIPALLFERDLGFVWDARSLLALGYLTFAGSAVTFSVYFWLLSRYPAKRLALIAYVIPIVAVGIGVLRGEPMTARILTGSAAVVLGVAVAVRKSG
jgi:drug/metabolite transporter (DMT)-like permease